MALPAGPGKRKRTLTVSSDEAVAAKTIGIGVLSVLRPAGRRIMRQSRQSVSGFRNWRQYEQYERDYIEHPGEQLLADEFNPNAGYGTGR